MFAAMTKGANACNLQSVFTFIVSDSQMMTFLNEHKSWNIRPDDRVSFRQDNRGHAIKANEQ